MQPVRRPFPLQSAGLLLAVCWRDNLSNLVSPPSRSQLAGWLTVPQCTSPTASDDQTVKEVKPHTCKWMCVWGGERRKHVPIIAHGSQRSEIWIFCVLSKTLRLVPTGRDGPDGWSGIRVHSAQRTSEANWVVHRWQKACVLCIVWLDQGFREYGMGCVWWWFTLGKFRHGLFENKCQKYQRFATTSESIELNRKERGTRK